MYFRCLKDARCEDIQAEGNTTYEFHPAKPRIQHSGVEQLLNPNFFTNLKDGNSFTEYAQLVRDFSQQSLTYESDVINAFKGVMVAVEPFLDTKSYFYGLPLDLFDRSLLWYPTSSSRRRWLGNSNITACPRGLGPAG
ncbi:hypothetical protein BDV23DRAFT_185991 [Aspergillus alliaceus]|uniref:Uncharacterized protein n=1 Tax=Petromyces alliaceus TaxID=209559 RepID=A0A5N7C2A5_PETAA|nr:hypothetical protein BDV23DRAFT_185991 [Aspergillus alliaceus]